MSATDTRFDEILRSFAKAGRRPHAPRFRVQREKPGWRVFDGDKAIAKFYPDCVDIWSFSPFEPDVIHNATEPDPVLDVHTAHNTYVNLGHSGWPASWRAAGAVPRMEWLKGSGRKLEARITLAGAENEGIEWRLRVSYDPAWRRYRYGWDIHAFKPDPASMEPLNMMIAGALASRPQERRWTHSVWADPNGKLRRIVHSNALFGCTDYGDEPMGRLWRTRNAPFRGAWVAYAAHDRFNPAVLVHETTVPLRFSTCSQLFDEHVIWADAGQENLGEDGLFHFRMRAELVNIGAGLARRLLAAAADPTKPRAWRHEQVALPFHLDRVNSFERALDPWKPEECPVLAVSAKAGAPVRWSSETAHTGRRSIRLECAGRSEYRELFPTGAVCNVKPHSRYRLTGWIKTAGVDRFARLELQAYEYKLDNVFASAVSAPVSGTQDWTCVSVELDSGEERYLLPKLVMHGAGMAWFDDVSLSEVR